MSTTRKKLYRASSLLLAGCFLISLLFLFMETSVADAAKGQPSPTTPASTTSGATTAAPTTKATTTAPTTTTAPATTAVPCDPQRDLRGSLSGATGTIVNSSTTCSYGVGMASYKWMDQDLDNQVLYSSTTNQVGPKQTVRLSVGLPNCKAQIDLFYGPVLTSFHGQYYGQRNLATNNTGGVYCAQVTRPPSTTAPATRTPSTTAPATTAPATTPAVTTAPVTTPAATTSVPATTAPATTPALTTAAATTAPSTTTPGGAAPTTVVSGNGPATTPPSEVLGEKQGPATPANAVGDQSATPQYKVLPESALPSGLPMTGSNTQANQGFTFYVLVALSSLLALSLVGLLLFSKRRTSR